MQSNDWWTSLLYKYYNGQTFLWEIHSWKLYAHPMSFLADRYGLKVFYPKTSSIENLYGFSNARYRYNMEMEDFTIGIDGMDLSTTDTVKVESYGDWHVKAVWNDGGGNELKATMAHGSPFVFCEKTGGDAYIRFLFGHTIDNTIGTNIIGFTHNGHHYGLFAPAGSTWNTASNYQHDENSFIAGAPNLMFREAFRSSLNGKDYFSIALLPDNTAATLADFAQYAFAFINDTQVSWSYNENTSKLTTTYTANTTIKEGSEGQTLQALYRHQWLNSSNINTTYTYDSAKGLMKVFKGNTFTTELTNYGIIPALPKALSSADATTLYNYIEDERQATSIYTIGNDSYWVGKRHSRQADLVYLAHQMGHTTARDKFLNDLKTELEDWLKADNGETDRGYFYYDDNWDTMIGYEASFGSDLRITDHHFHYGYHIKAAAAVAQFDQTWAQDANWGGMIKLLIRDVANWEHSNTMFPFLRNFDAYAGHSWASGHGNSHWGNDQESSSEAINFAASVYQFGMATNNNTLRDLGLYLYLTEAESVRQYWWDVDDAIQPAAYNYTTATRLWGNGADRLSGNASFELEPEYWLGINLLPMDGASLYLTWDGNLAQTLYNEMVSLNGGVEDDLWEDLMWTFQALTEPSTALSKYSTHTTPTVYNTNLPYTPSVNGIYDPLSGDQIAPAQLFHWLNVLDSLGQVDVTVTADYSAAVVFNNSGEKHYAIYNPPNAGARTVTFSDGTIANVPADTLILYTAAALPVELIFFEASLLDNQSVILNWQTANEILIDYFEIEKKGGEGTWESLERIAAQYKEGALYEIKDEESLSGISYYRLKIVEQNGAFQYSKIVSIEKESFPFNIYPNPTENLLFIENARNFRGNIQILNNHGEVVFRKEISNPPIVLNLKELELGLYFVLIANEHGQVVKMEKILRAN